MDMSNTRQLQLCLLALHKSGTAPTEKRLLLYDYVSVVQGSPQGDSQHELVDWCGKMLKDREVFLSVLGLNSQPMGC